MKKEMSGVEREKNKTKDWRRRKRVEQNKQKKKSNVHFRTTTKKIL